MSTRTKGRTSRPLDAGRAGHTAGIARRLRGQRPGVPSVLFLVVSAVVLLAVMVGLGWLLARYATGTALADTDSSLARTLAAQRNPTMNTITGVMSGWGATITIVSIGVVAAVAFRLRFKRWREASLIAAGLIGEVLIFLGTTALVDRERPPVPHLDEAPPTSSFPSGHTAASTVLYGALAVVAWQRLRPGPARALLTVLAVFLPLAVAGARMYRGMHFLTDVLGGLLLGSVWLFVAVRAVRMGVLHKELKGGGRTSGAVRRKTRR